MTKAHHSATRMYLDKAVRNLDLSDIQLLRKKFEVLSKSIIKIPIKTVFDLHIESVGIGARVYYDRTEDIDQPIVIFFHGGGFAVGSLESHDSVCRDIAKHTNATVLSIAYSLAPEQKYPRQAQQGVAVVEWLRKNGSIKNAGKRNVFLAGDSAGGNIALQTALRLVKSKAIQGLILIYPTLDPSPATESAKKYEQGYFLSKKILDRCWELYLETPDDYKSPTQKQLRQLPPVLLISAHDDILRDEGAMFIETLRQLGNEAEYECYTDMIHGFVQFPRPISKKSKVFTRVGVFIQKHTAEL